MTTYRNEAAQVARNRGIPVDLFLALVNQESRWNPNARSPVGALGLAQLMPDTAKYLGVDPHDPMQNLDGGARYLKEQFDKFGDWKLALAAYNAGPGRVTEYGGIPPFKETQNYVSTIMGSLNSGAEVASDAMIALGHPDRARSGGNAPVGSAPPPAASVSTMGQPQQPPFDPAAMAGLMSMFNAQDEEAQRPGWVEQKTRGFLNDDRLDALTIGLEGMTLAPNQTLMASAAADRTQRKTDKRDAATRNRTAAWLAAQGREDLAALLASGSLTGSDAVKLALTKDEGPALQQNVEYLMSIGFSKEEALDRVARAAGAPGDSYGPVPAGYRQVVRRNPDGSTSVSMELIENSPAAIEQQTLQEKEGLAAENSAAQADTVLTAIQTIREKEASDGLPVTGWGGAIGRNLPNTDARAVRGLLDTIHSSIAFDKLQAMRAASPTGGALGAVSERELALLQSSLANLDQLQDANAFLVQLDRVEAMYKEIMRKAAAYPNAAQFLGNIGSEFLPGGGGAANGGGTGGGTAGGLSWRVVQ